MYSYTEPVKERTQSTYNGTPRADCIQAPMAWLEKFPCSLLHSYEGVELVQCSVTWTETVLFFLNVRFD